MPASSKAQQKFMGLVHAIQKGEVSPSDVSSTAKKVAKDMKPSDVTDFASTKHKGLPNKVKQEIVRRLKEYAMMIPNHQTQPSAPADSLRSDDEMDVNENFPTNWLAGRVSDQHTKLGTTPREDYDDTNFDKEDSGQEDLENENMNEAPEIKTLTKKEWSKIKNFNKHIGQDGTYYVMAYSDKLGTHLNPVKIVKESKLNESWDIKDGKVLYNNNLIGYYEFDRDSDSFWVADVKRGKGQLSFDTKREVEDYFKKNAKDALKHLGKMRESVNESSDFVYYDVKQIGPEVKKILGNLIQSVEPYSNNKSDKGHIKFNFVDINAKHKFLSKEKSYVNSIEKALSRKFKKDVLLAGITHGSSMVSYDIFSDINESVNESSNPSDIIKDLDKVRTDLIKKVDILIAKKKKLYSDVDIESPMSADEKKLDKDIQTIFSQIQQIIQQKRKIKTESINDELSGNEREMVVGIIDILKQVKDKENRKEIALNMIKQFKEENIDFDYSKFLSQLKEYGSNLTDTFLLPRHSDKLPGTPDEKNAIDNPDTEDGNLYEVGLGDWHFKAIQKLYQKAGAFGRKKIAAVITKNPNSNWSKIERELQDSDYYDISDYSDKLGLSEVVENIIKKRTK